MTFPTGAVRASDPGRAGPAYLLEGTARGHGQLTQGAMGSSDPLRTKPARQCSQWSPSVLCWQPWGRRDGSALTVEALLPTSSHRNRARDLMPKASQCPTQDTSLPPDPSVSVLLTQRPLVFPIFPSLRLGCLPCPCRTPLTTQTPEPGRQRSEWPWH